MTLYLDMSLIVAALTSEAASARAQEWLEEQSIGSLATSEWTETEVAAALSIKVRTGVLTPVDRERVAVRWRRMAEDAVSILPVRDGLFHTAARLADRFESGLRAGDALHLAIASDAGMALWTLDRRLAEAGPKLGLYTNLLT